ncbi:flagellar motor protein MotD [Acidithiobacillus sp. CV18-2]|uniref:Flagellar motor protein MotD n=1 Tax=Igneacidithiobacillus copahuensis TaxID=2724909 RepID=A0AAE2YNM6_9PROT|nr:flagellar motor protein MotD [Igneacidithiobacillus copahuensis]MBU2754418.1 flagellar motor protein MotD [Acidithiobacillus sp. CV18-3]MBU2757559.1 flagellar motor protein MotD [Acidithiobacillus sp. BN09-2]MBU2777126.1 flagellar motor protein MotD [Acidithiobacillus sp. CV18-2]MBU2797439.1 flagellar motor protein MotD [Acidithiobacillus sp. VAN18-2]MBU2799723.1 flagellar motor protein MotD [Acidithiobacillus sp. VAN18-4]UTV81890.1 flagellar motor protein MotD [Acidithiobacillus sp. YTS05
MARRSRKEEEWENHERWLVSYADFITLLFAFFVVMYAISSVNEGKYKVLSETLVSAFSGHPTSPIPLQQEQANQAMAATAPVRLPPLPTIAKPTPLPAHTRSKTPPPTATSSEAVRLDTLQQQMETLLQPLIKDGSVVIHRSDLGVVIDLNAKILFPSAQANLTPAAEQTLTQIARVLKSVPYQIQVNGFTNDLPINTQLYPNNWALSAARAVAVVEIFSAHGVDPRHLVAAGYGKYHPVAPNDSVKGLAMNRRVSIVVVAPQHPAKAGMDPIMAGAIDQRG